MGFRFSYDQVNVIAHFVDGNVMLFLRDSQESRRQFEDNFNCLERILQQFKNNFFTASNFYYKNVINRIAYHEEKLHKIRYSFDCEQFTENEHKPINLDNKNTQELLKTLYSISKIIGAAKTKSILLPGFSDEEFNRSLISEDLMIDLVKIHPKDSCLILQPDEIIDKKKIYTYNTFRSMKTALMHIDEWPGIMLWNESGDRFIPIRSNADLIDVFNHLHYTNGDLMSIALKPKKNAYFIHLSDLHFGNEKSNRRKSRLLKLIENEVAEIDRTDQEASIYPIITGDLVDSPNGINFRDFEEFRERLVSLGTKQLNYVLGNHDINTNGLALLNRVESLSSLPDKNIEIIEDLKIVLIKFDSNITGKLAQGQIGEEQLIRIGNELDSIEKIRDYTLVGMLHHHVVPITDPEWKEKEWYKKISLGRLIYDKSMELLDAEVFIEWLEKRKVKIVLHGHKHIPAIRENSDLKIVACGSSTGKVEHVDKGKTYISYNVLKYDICKKKFVSCVIKYEDVAGGGVQHLQAEKW